MGINNGTNPINYSSNNKPYYEVNTDSDDTLNAPRQYPNNFIYSGALDGGWLGSRGFEGLYWSASGYSNYSASDTYFSYLNIYPGTSYHEKYRGRVVRCVADT